MGRYHQFEVNIDAVLAGINYMDTMGARSPEIVQAMRGIAKSALIEVFEYAMYEANENEGFPYEFQQHTMDVIRGFQGIDVSWYGAGIVVGVDFDQLGDEQDLRKAFHQGARLAGSNEHVWGPYDDQDLAQEDSYQAHTFWEAVRNNSSHYVSPKTGKEIKMEKLV